MEKKQEIEILQSLKGDTYFNQFFGVHDIDVMCGNIKNDFPIELNCAFNKKAELLGKQLDELGKKAKEDERSFVRELITDFEGDIPLNIYKRLIDKVGVLFIINFKRDMGYPLTEEEIDWLVMIVNDSTICKI